MLLLVRFVLSVEKNKFRPVQGITVESEDVEVGNGIFAPLEGGNGGSTFLIANIFSLCLTCGNGLVWREIETKTEILALAAFG